MFFFEKVTKLWNKYGPLTTRVAESKKMEEVYDIIHEDEDEKQVAENLAANQSFEEANDTESIDTTTNDSPVLQSFSVISDEFIPLLQDNVSYTKETLFKELQVFAILLLLLLSLLLLLLL